MITFLIFEIGCEIELTITTSFDVCLFLSLVCIVDSWLREFLVVGIIQE